MLWIDAKQFFGQGRMRSVRVIFSQQGWILQASVPAKGVASVVFCLSWNNSDQVYFSRPCSHWGQTSLENECKSMVSLHSKAF